MEDRATLQVLASLGCDLAQGYHFSPPVGAAELAGWAAGVGPGGLAQPERDSVEAARGERVRGRSAHLAAEEDFLARKRAEAALRASEERYRSVVDSVRDIIFQSDADGRWTVTATSGEQALERLAADPFDVVISDVGMGPGMNGWELAAEVRRRWPHMRLVLATGWGAAIDPTGARTRGVDAVLAKPYQPADLRQLLLERLSPALAQPEAA